jgi:arsenite methyltransferase
MMLKPERLKSCIYPMRHLGDESVLLSWWHYPLGMYFWILVAAPGFLSVEASEIVEPNGAVHAVDSSESMLGMAQARAKQSSSSDLIRFDAGDAVKLPFPDEYFDAAAILQVYEYVGDIATALSELHRVIKPNGRFVIIDTDWETLGMESTQAELTKKIFKVFEGHLAHPSLPRTLEPSLRAAGLEVLDVEPFVQMSAGKPDVFANAVIKIVKDYVTGKDGLTDDEVDKWVADLEALGSEGSFFWSLCQFFFKGRKP